MSQRSPAATTCHDSLKPMPFDIYSDSPEDWFIILECQFKQAKVDKEHDRWLHAVLGISKHRDTAFKLRDLFSKPHPEAPYSDLKANVIKRMQKSVEAKLEALIAATDRGDRKPSEYLRDLQQMIQPHATGAISDTLVRRALLKSLPSHLQVVLEAVSSKYTLEDLADAADKALERTPKMVESVQMVPDTKLHAEIAELKSELAALKMNGNQRNRPNFRNKNDRKRTHNDQGICFYHEKYKASAKKCIQPCKFKQEN